MNQEQQTNTAHKEGVQDARQRTVALHNLGCKVNSYEAEAMLAEMKKAGFLVVPWEERADVYIINTCSVTNIADRKSRQMLHKARSKNPDAVVIGVGCYVQAKAEELKKDAAVDILIGNNRKNDIAKVVEEYLAEKRAQSYVDDLSHPTDYEDMYAADMSDKARAFIKVQDGCNQFCSYCIIPFVRGRIRSRSLSDTVREVEALAAGGYKEVVLTGIHLSSYGLDFENESYEHHMKHAVSSEKLIELIEAVAAVEGIERVRLGSLEPRVITQAFAERLQRIPELCPHFHLSLQSGCDRTLQAMNRHYTTEQFRESCRILRETFADCAITTDVIAGFPGESEADFEESYRFVEEIGFYELHVFKYSRRGGTVADRMPNQLTDREKTARSERLIALGEAQSEAFRTRFVGRSSDVLIEELVEIDGTSYLTGYNKAYVKYLIPAEGVENAAAQIGTIMQVDGFEICKACILAK